MIAYLRAAVEKALVEAIDRTKVELAAGGWLKRGDHEGAKLVGQISGLEKARELLTAEYAKFERDEEDEDETDE